MDCLDEMIENSIDLNNEGLIMEKGISKTTCQFISCIDNPMDWIDRQLHKTTSKENLNYLERFLHEHN